MLLQINEAFASQFAYCVQQLDIPIEKINPNGGAIAITHPLGMSEFSSSLVLDSSVPRLIHSSAHTFSSRISRRDGFCHGFIGRIPQYMPSSRSC